VATKRALQQCPTCRGAVWVVCPQCRGNRLIPLAVLPLLQLRTPPEASDEDVRDARLLMRLEA
jgi:hypothetical protein